MIVDDEPEFRDVLCRMAVRLGHEVEAAGDGNDAVKRGQHFQSDILIADWKLGGSMSGLEVARLIGEQSPGMITIIISGNPWLELPGVEPNDEISLLAKPFGLDELRAALDMALERLPKDRK